MENLGKYHEGLKEALLSKELYGKDGFSHVHDRLIGKAYDELGDYENAIKHYELFLKGRSYAPNSDDYKEAKKKISELENKKSNLKSLKRKRLGKSSFRMKGTLSLTWALHRIVTTNQGMEDSRQQTRYLLLVG